MDQDDASEVTFDLAENLRIHHLDVTPDESTRTIEFVVHAEIQGVDDTQLRQVEGSRLELDRLTCTVVDECW